MSGRRAALVLALFAGVAGEPSPMAAETESTIPLPRPLVSGTAPLSEALASRRSVREFTPRALTLAEAASILWAAQGRIAPDGQRTAPSAGALFPLELYLAAGKVEGLRPGLYRYRSEGHRLERIAAGDPRPDLAQASAGQDWIAEAPAILVMTAVTGRTTAKYGERGLRYIFMEAGHAGQNIYLQAGALGLGTTAVGAFINGLVKEVLSLGAGEEPLMLYPVGEPR